ncbi:MAG: hypothetical protein WCO99_14910, partial [Planctomycetota bacterium]
MTDPALNPPDQSGRPRWSVSRRAAAFDSSGIRKAFDLAARLNDPINLSIGQPDFAMPPAAREAAKAATEYFGGQRQRLTEIDKQLTALDSGGSAG